MSRPWEKGRSITRSETLHPGAAGVLRRGDAVALVVGTAALAILHGLRNINRLVYGELGVLIFLCVAWLAVSLALRYRWSRVRVTFRREYRAAILTSLLWLAGLVGILIFGRILPERFGGELNRAEEALAWSEICLLLRAVTGGVSATRRATGGGTNPAVILVASFAVLIAVGTLLLMLPRARPEGEPNAGLLTALFTSTSASCVTGLVVEPTGTYWSRFGQVVILCLFQLGGLGIMTCGAFFAVFAGRQMQIRESVTLRDMLESEHLGDARRMVLAILVFTFAAEAIGAVFLLTLWPDKPFGERLYLSVFHSVSSFCNAGFSLTEDSFVGFGNRWQVWGVVAGLIVVGGLGFSVLYNVVLTARGRLSGVTARHVFRSVHTRARLNLTTRLALATSVALLLGGAAGYLALESTAGQTGKPVAERLSEAWFQSVTFRTAGFNTVDHAGLQPATRLWAIMLMFIGASPGSTGGGVKTVCFALVVLTLVSILRGRGRVEIAGRTVPQEIINRALIVISLGLMLVMATTLLLVVFEGGRHEFLNLMFEATSAFATVGVSAGVTSGLTDPSRIVIAVTMFLGRVGPLTLLLALAGRSEDARYDYPLERVALG